MKKLLLIAAALALTLVVLPGTPAGAGAQRSTTVTKIVEGTGPSGPYDFEIDCDGFVEDFSLEDGESLTGSGNAAMCTVAEVGDQGADSVAYSCEVLSGAATCADDRTVTWPAGAAGTAEITVTNTFDDPVTTTTEAPSVSPSTAAAAPATVATPTFTG